MAKAHDWLRIVNWLFSLHWLRISGFHARTLFPASSSNKLKSLSPPLLASTSTPHPHPPPLGRTSQLLCLLFSLEYILPDPPFRRLRFPVHSTKSVTCAMESQLMNLIHHPLAVRPSGPSVMTVGGRLFCNVTWKSNAAAVWIMDWWDSITRCKSIAFKSIY